MFRYGIQIIYSDPFSPRLRPAQTLILRPDSGPVQTPPHSETPPLQLPYRSDRKCGNRYHRFLSHHRDLMRFCLLLG